MKRRELLKLIAALPAMQSSVEAWADTAPWPQRGIKMVVAFPPGGQADLAARPIADALQRGLGQAVIVENRGGAGGKIGHALVARSEPDGYTLLCTPPSLVVLPEADRLLGTPPAYEVSDFAPIARILADPTLLAVSTSAPWKTPEEFIAAAKAAPGTIPYGSSGSYGTLHIAMEMFAASAGVKLLHVPYTGAGPALNGLLAGNVQAMAATPGVIKAQVDAGAVRVLANWGAERIASFPNVKTFRQMGYADVEYYNWAGVFAPRATPVAVIERLRGQIKIAMVDPSVIKIFESADSPPAWLDAPAFASFLAADSARLTLAVRKIGKVD
jgi:tripartite-type tricarboxylate transporter receptor subunit TctC